ncbi:hypothetical protein AVEN_217241-1 [Araneus ventricosus]|uniref:Reverse transcriptase domain-containing protein n=1 Tax=Araneus ventricosus TaxID=182803 RepID=A0A4Y2PEX9_ARAVE|nr:hypothetical protein AVEN_217241-1 [Araneus ventricosus]
MVGQVQIQLKEKAAFITAQGLRQFKLMPFELCDAPATFQRLIETLLRELSSEACLVHQDDITIVRRTFEEHLNIIRKVFQRLQKANLKLSPKNADSSERSVLILDTLFKQKDLKLIQKKLRQ